MTDKKTTESKAPWHARQGDVMVMALDGGKFHPNTAIPDDAVAADDKGRVVLAYGEVTGHAHAFREGKATRKVSESRKGVNYLTNVAEPLLHEEHSAIPVHEVPATGSGFLSIIQQEYEPQGLRNVAD